MLVFKFGGASVKDSKGVKNLLNIVKDYTDNLIIVISALGKTTNALEEILKTSIEDLNKSYSKYEDLKSYHLELVKELFPNENDKIYKDIKEEFDNLKKELNNKTYSSYDKKYDQVVSFGEILSTKIVSAFLNSQQLSNSWVDIRKVFITDDVFREASIDFEKTSINAESVFNFKNQTIYLTQGFIGATNDGFVTTLGREGSDYTAAALANVLNADKVIVWKDVDGILNADPQYFQDTEKLDKISYQEAVELAYFGAKVIHPKTLKPLHNKNIPLFVRSFIKPEGSGTEIDCFKKYDQNLPIFILKKDQMLISLFPKDLSFVFEDELSKIFKYLSEHRIRVNLIQNSAISISLCIDNSNSKSKQLIERFKEDYKVLYNDQLELLTIRHYSEDAIQKVTKGKKIYIEQRSRHTAHFVIK
ncbi:MAG TPA: aspartate kinase [Bacteroidales bacterium]|jgi:aspartate kinase|nr:aspartate kinase [Bacteroidales bacterium]